EHLERGFLTPGPAQELAPGPVGLDVVAPVAVLLEYLGRLAEGLVGAVVIAGERQPLGQGPESVAALVGELLAGDPQRRLCTLDGFLAAAEEHRAPGLVAVEVDEVLLLRARAEQALGPVEMRARLLRAVLRHQNVAAEQVRPREMEAVVR